MEKKGEQWNQFASKFGFEVNGQYQHYHCRVNGKIDLPGITFLFEGHRQYVDRIPQILIDTFSEVFTVTSNLNGLISNEEFYFGKPSFLKRIKFWSKGTRIHKHHGFTLASNNTSFALGIINTLNWAINHILFVELSQKCLTIKFNHLPDDDKEFELLYESLSKIKTVANRVDGL